MLLASVHSEPPIALHSVSEAALPYIHNLKHNIWDKPKEAGNYVKCYILSDLRRVTVFLEFEPGRHISNQEDQRAKLEKKHHWRQYIATSVNFKKRSRHLELMVVVWVLLTENSSSLTLLGSVVHLAHSKAVCRGSWCLRSLHDLILRYMIGLIQLSDSNSSSLSWPPDLLDETDFLWMNLALSFPPSAKIWFYMLLLAKGFLLFTSTHLSFPCSNYLRSTFTPLSPLLSSLFSSEEAISFRTEVKISLVIVFLICRLSIIVRSLRRHSCIIWKFRGISLLPAYYHSCLTLWRCKGGGSSNFSFTNEIPFYRGLAGYFYLSWISWKMTSPSSVNGFCDWIRPSRSFGS